MRNLKKFLALVLAMMMVMGLMVTANAKSLDKFTDGTDVDPKYQTAADVLSQLDIIRGQGDGTNWAPEQILKRSEVATLVYRVMTGDVKDTYVVDWEKWDLFDDLADAAWAAGYINYAANAKIVFGNGEGQFVPNGDITGYQMLAIMLRVLGYGQQGEYQGDRWEYAVFEDATTLGLIRGVALDLSQPIQRQVVAQIIYNAMGIELVEWNGLRYVGQEKNLIGTSATTSFNSWGRPTTKVTATYNKMK